MKTTKEDFEKIILKEVTIDWTNISEASKAAAACYELAKQMQPKWIPVSERQPEYGVQVLVLLGSEFAVARTYQLGEKQVFYESCSGSDIHPTHWQPITPLTNSL